MSGVSGAPALPTHAIASECVVERGSVVGEAREWREFLEELSDFDKMKAQVGGYFRVSSIELLFV